MLDERLGPFRNVQRHVIHEGERWSLGREDGTLDGGGLTEVGEFLSVTISQIPGMTQEELMGALTEFADRLAESTQRFLFERMDQQLTDAGRSFDAGGRRFTPDVLLEMLDTMEITFDADGTPRLPTLVTHPSQIETLKAMPEWSAEGATAFQRRLDDLVARKRDEWRAREASRKLVD